MLERVQRAWDRLHHRPMLYRRVDNEDVIGDEEPGEATEDWCPMMTTSLYCPGADGELAIDCRRLKSGRRSSTEAARTGFDDSDWCSLTLGRTQRRCHCAAASTTVVREHTVPGDGDTTTDCARLNETLPRFKSPLLGRRLRTLVADDHTSNVASGSASCPGSPRDVARLSAAVGGRLQLGLSPRLSARRNRRRADMSVHVNSHVHQPRQVLLNYFLPPFQRQQNIVENFSQWDNTSPPSFSPSADYFYRLFTVRLLFHFHAKCHILVRPGTRAWGSCFSPRLVPYPPPKHITCPAPVRYVTTCLSQTKFCVIVTTRLYANQSINQSIMYTCSLFR